LHCCRSAFLHPASVTCALSLFNVLMRGASGIQGWICWLCSSASVNAVMRSSC
jgi:hypothetical protein